MDPTRRRFIVRHGVLGWGLTTGVTWSVAMTFISRKPDEDTLVTFVVYLAGLPLWLVGGYVWGALMWKRVRKRRQMPPPDSP